MKEYIIKKMLKNSLLVENVKTGEEMFIHRRIFNLLMNNPELPIFKVEREFQGKTSHWLATPTTM